MIVDSYDCEYNFTAIHIATPKSDVFFADFIVFYIFPLCFALMPSHPFIIKLFNPNGFV